jgi:hypothetical protein
MDVNAWNQGLFHVKGTERAFIAHGWTNSKGSRTSEGKGERGREKNDREARFGRTLHGESIVRDVRATSVRQDPRADERDMAREQLGAEDGGLHRRIVLHQFARGFFRLGLEDHEAEARRIGV